MSHVLVIGAGIGGIATAARLARNGYRVTVLEKNAGPGGRCGRAEAEGYRFDTGATLLLMRDFYEGAFRDLGERMEDHLDLVRVDPTYHLHFGDGSSLTLSSDLERMREQLEAFEPGSYAAFLDYMEEGARRYRLAIPRFMAREYRSLPEFLSPGNLLTFARLNAMTRHYDDVSAHFKDERLRTAFTFQNLYMGLSPYLAPATFSLIQYTEFADGIWFPKGGMYRVVQALVSIAEKAGVRFLYNTPVDRINVDEDRATGVTLADGGRIDADIVVANADLTYVYRHLLPHDATTHRIERRHHGTSAVVFYWGLDRTYPELAPHSLFFAKDIRRGYGPLFDDRGLPEDPHFYVHAPARLDASAAPPGGDSLYVGVPSGHLDETNPQDWEGLKTRAREAVLRRFEAFGLHDLQDHIQVEIARTPVDWAREYNLVKGSTHGLSHELTQMAYLRPHNRHARYRNLYFVGASTHPGTGLPNVLVSAGFAAGRILDDDAAVVRPSPVPQPAQHSPRSSSATASLLTAAEAFR